MGRTAELFTSAFAIAEINALYRGISSPGKATAQNAVADAYMMKHIRSTAAVKAPCITNGKGCRTAVITQMRDSIPAMGGEVFAFAKNGGIITHLSAIGHLQTDIEKDYLLTAST